MCLSAKDKNGKVIYAPNIVVLSKEKKMLEINESDILACYDFLTPHFHYTTTLPLFR